MWYNDRSKRPRLQMPTEPADHVFFNFPCPLGFPKHRYWLLSLYTSAKISANDVCKGAWTLGDAAKDLGVDDLARAPGTEEMPMQDATAMLPAQAVAHERGEQTKPAPWPSRGGEQTKPTSLPSQCPNTPTSVASTAVSSILRTPTSETSTVSEDTSTGVKYPLAAKLIKKKLKIKIHNKQKKLAPGAGSASSMNSVAAVSARLRNAKKRKLAPGAKKRNKR